MERHVGGDASSWAHFLFLHSIQAFGRASLECMRGHALFSCTRGGLRGGFKRGIINEASS